MNLDLITKLAKLANNNPNDNEANAAARKVCRLLAEGEFKFNGSSSSPIPPGNRPEDGGTWNDVRRSAESFWKSYYPYEREYNTRPPTNPKPDPKVKCKVCKVEYSIDANPYYFVCASCQENAQKVKDQQSRTTWDDEVEVDDFDFFVSILNGSSRGGKRVKLEKDMTCTKCKAVFETAYVGVPETFICFGCQRKV